MSGRTQATDAAVALAVTTLATTYVWATATLPCKGLEWIAAHLDIDYDGLTSIQVKMQSQDAGGLWHNVQRTDAYGLSALDEMTHTSAAADESLVHLWFVGPFNQVRFLAKRTGGSSTDAAGMDWSGV